MNSRLFIGNFDFEHRLAAPKRDTPSKLHRLNAELATSWLSIAEDGDWIWTPSPINGEFFHEARQRGLPKVTPVTSFASVPKNVICVPWGWTTQIRRLAQTYSWKFRAPPELAVAQANSRSTSEDLERQWGVGLLNARRIESLQDLQQAIRTLRPAGAPWVVKAEFGMSARERILGRGELTLSNENWLRRRLAAQKVVFFEPWVERIGEVGIQIEIPEFGKPQLIGLTPMLVDRRGQYAGSWFSFQESRFSTEKLDWQEAIDIALRAACRLQNIGYFGPAGFDAMVYRNEDGMAKLRPMQDINARWTMGRLSLGWKKLLTVGDEGCWRFGPANDETTAKTCSTIEMIPTSPAIVGGSRSFHTSRVFIVKPQQQNE